MKEDPTLEVKKTEILETGTPLPRRRIDSEHYMAEVTVPAAKKENSNTEKEHWILELLPRNDAQKILRIKILDDFTIGRQRSGNNVDLDLTYFDAAKLGVSGVHATIRVSAEGLYLHDLNSSNGTYYHWKQIKGDDRAKIYAGDDIAFGKLIFRVVNLSKEL